MNLRIHNIYPKIGHEIYFINRYSFNLSVISSGNRFAPKLKQPANEKLQRALALNNDPYALKPDGQRHSVHESYDKLKLIRTVKRCEFIARHCPIIIPAYLKRNIGLIGCTQDALHQYRITSMRDQRLSCLPRTLFAAKTSRSFAQNGVLFIGCRFPATALHAWIIEGHSQPEEEDRDWINFAPVLAIYYDD